MSEESRAIDLYMPVRCCLCDLEDTIVQLTILLPAGEEMDAFRQGRKAVQGLACLQAMKHTKKSHSPEAFLLAFGAEADTAIAELTDALAILGIEDLEETDLVIYPDGRASVINYN